ncbi:hypothetical protein MKW92_051254, partial [Papaver armeniacum]
MEKSCSLLIDFDKETPALANEIEESLEGSDVVAKVQAVKKAVINVLPEMILICQNNLQHPNEYIITFLPMLIAFWGELLQIVVLELIRQVCRTNLLQSQ